MISMKAWRWWFYPAIAAFGILEGIAIFNDVGGDTLSEYVWAMGVMRGVIVVFLIWLTVHFAFKGKVW